MYSRRALAALLAIVPSVLAQTTDPSLIAKLRAAPTHPDRISLLKDDQYVFNFLAGVGSSTGSSGSTTSANSGNFPALIGNGISMTYGYLGPCGLNIPHTHPRATEINIAVNGSLRTGMLAENGARFVFNNVPAGSATVFPRGAIHFEMNLECKPTLFIAAFNDEDPGTLAIAQRFFGLPTDIVQASLDSIGIVEIAGMESKIPNNVAYGTEECLKRCGISHGSQPTTQRQPRLSSNPLPPGYSGPPPPGQAASPPPTSPSPYSAPSYSPSPSPYSPSPSPYSPPPPPPPPPQASPTPPTHSNLDNMFGDGSVRVQGAAANVGSENGESGSDIKPFLIALVVINAILVIGILAAVAFWLSRSRRNDNPRMRDPAAPQFAPLREEKDTEYYDPYQPRTPTPMNADRQ